MISMENEELLKRIQLLEREATRLRALHANAPICEQVPMESGIPVDPAAQNAMGTAAINTFHEPGHKGDPRRVQQTSESDSSGDEANAPRGRDVLRNVPAPDHLPVRPKPRTLLGKGITLLFQRSKPMNFQIINCSQTYQNPHTILLVIWVI